MSRKKFNILEISRYNVIENTKYGESEFIITVIKKNRNIIEDDKVVGIDEQTEYILSRNDNDKVWTASSINEVLIKVTDTGNGLIIDTMDIVNFADGNEVPYDESMCLYMVLNFMNTIDTNLFIQYRFEKINQE